MDLATFLIQCLNSVQYGLLLFLVASGLTLIFGIMGVINLAHGSFYMIGAYMAYALAPVVASTFGGGFFATLVVGFALSIVLGYLLEWAFFSFLYEREHLQQVLMTYGLILVFEELRSIIVGDDVHGVEAPAILAGTLPLGDIMTLLAERITVNPDQCGGRPCVRGLRIRVTDVLDLLAAGLTTAQVIDELPDLDREDIAACLRFASKRIDHPIVAA